MQDLEGGSEAAAGVYVCEVGQPLWLSAGNPGGVGQQVAHNCHHFPWIPLQFFTLLGQVCVQLHDKGDQRAPLTAHLLHQGWRQ